MKTEEELKNKYIADLYDDFRYCIEKFDSQALYLSSGALALSLTFLKDIVPIKDAKLLCLYYISLILFCLTILTGFLAHYISARLIMKRIKKVENDDYIVKDNKWISILNGFVIGTLLVGIGLLITFTIINIDFVKNNESKFVVNRTIIEKMQKNNSTKRIEREVKQCNFIDIVKLNN